MRILLIVMTIVLLTGCDSQTNANHARFPAEQLMLGEQVFTKNCQECHGVGAAGTVREWQKRLPDGTLPAPPLNGTAHAWHHNDKVLLRTVNNGGIPLGGTMPPFKDVLSEEEKIAVLAYIKNLWPEELYQAWLANNG